MWQRGLKREQVGSMNLQTSPSSTFRIPGCSTKVPHSTMLPCFKKQRSQLTHDSVYPTQWAPRGWYWLLRLLCRTATPEIKMKFWRWSLTMAALWVFSSCPDSASHFPLQNMILQTGSSVSKHWNINYFSPKDRISLIPEHFSVANMSFTNMNSSSPKQHMAPHWTDWWQKTLF